MRRLFIVICALLLYGSLYPWQFHPWGSLWDAVLRVFHSWPLRTSFSDAEDMALNVVAYAPLGLTGYLAGSAGFRWRRALWPIAFGFFFSLTVETLQSYIPSRVPSGSDLLCNTLGTAAGVALAAAYETVLGTWFERLNRRAKRPSSALMMLIVFIGHYLVPFSNNALRLLSVYHRPPPIGQDWNLIDFFNTAVTWMLAGRFAEAAAGKSRWAFPVLAAAFCSAVAGRLASPNLLFTWTMLAAAAVGLIIWRVLEGRGLEIQFGILTLIWLLVDGLRPYTFTGHKSFDWIPFLGLLGNDWSSGITSLLNKLWMYGAAFWTWERAGLTRVRALAALLVVLSSIEFAQQYLPGRVSAMTDIAMGLISAGLLWAVERKYG